MILTDGQVDWLITSDSFCTNSHRVTKWLIVRLYVRVDLIRYIHHHHHHHQLKSDITLSWQYHEVENFQPAPSSRTVHGAYITL